MGNENGREIRAQRKRRRKNSTVHGDCLCHTESQTTFWPKTYILLAGAISYSCATCGTHSTANQRALATTGQRPYQSASTGACADHLPSPPQNSRPRLGDLADEHNPHSTPAPA